MIDAGVPLLQSLKSFIRRKTHRCARLSNLLQTEVSEGKTIAEAMRKATRFFKALLQLSKGGRIGGILDAVLEKLMQHMDRQEKTRKAIKSAMTYPAIVVVVGIGVVILMMTIVVPMMQDLALIKQSRVTWYYFVRYWCL